MALADALAPFTTIVFITHHSDEYLPCLSHVLHLVEGKVAYIGERSSWRPP